MFVFFKTRFSEIIVDFGGLGRAYGMREFLTVLARWKDFQGRSTRREFWMYTLVLTLLSVLLGVLDLILLGEEAALTQLFTLSNAFSLITIIPGLSVSVRRLHDIGKSGWWLLVILTVVGAFLIIYWNCVASDEGENAYGAGSISDGATPSA